MNIRQLRYFVAAVDLSNITLAARKMHVAQPALGQQIRELEAHLGVTLLRRHSRGVSTTPAGELLYKRAKTILEQLESTQQEVVRLHRAQRRPVALGLTTSMTLLVAAQLQLLAPARYPTLALSLVEGPSFFLADALTREELDVALVCDIEARPALALKAVMEEELLFVCARPLPGGGDSVGLDTVLASRLALGMPRDIGRKILARAAGCVPGELPIAWEAQSMSAIVDLVVRGDACSVMPWGSIAREVAAGRACAYRVRDASLRQTLFVARRAGLVESAAPDGEEALGDFMDWVADTVAQSVGVYGSRL